MVAHAHAPAVVDLLDGALVDVLAVEAVGGEGVTERAHAAVGARDVVASGGSI